MRSMIVQVPMMSGPAGVLLVEVSVPYVAALIGDDGKYYMTPKRIDDPTEKRRYRHRGPTLRSLVKLALACDSAEQMGKQLRRRFDRSLARQGQAAPRRATARDLAELDQLLG